MDSNYERRTFAELKRLQQFLANKKGIRMAIEKPMLDIRSGEDLVDPAIEIGEPCIPDFVLQTEAAPAGGAAVVIVETMSFACDAYRLCKIVTHRLMEATLQAPLLTHDFHLPATQNRNNATGGSGRRPVGCGKYHK
jgi:hypothetical protein